MNAVGKFQSGQTAVAGEDGQPRQRHAARRLDLAITDHPNLVELPRGDHHAGQTLVGGQDVRARAEDGGDGLQIGAKPQGCGQLVLGLGEDHQGGGSADAEGGMAATRLVAPRL